MRHQVVCLFASSLALIASPVYAQTPDSVTSFSSNITINQDVSLAIQETIEYQTTVAKHGIYRYIPYTYRRNGVVYTNTVSAISVTNAQGTKIPFTQTKDSQNITLKIGYPEKTFTGKQSYQISYAITDAINRFDGYDELYWDITGEGWTIPVQSSSVTITSPYATPIEAICFSGKVGTNDDRCTIAIKDGFAQGEYPYLIENDQNFTVALKLDPHNQLIFPTQVDKLNRSLRANLPLLFIPVPLLLSFMLWYYKGRDWESVSGNIFNLDPDQPKRLVPLLAPARIPFIYEPLQGVTPGQAGGVIDEKIDHRDIIADIIDLARKKYLSIEQTEDKGFIFKSKDYLFKKLKNADTKLPLHQQTLLNGLFSASVSLTHELKNTFTQTILNGQLTQQGSSNTKLTPDKSRHIDILKQVKLSDLKGSFHTTMSSVHSQMSQELVEQKLYTSDPKKSRALGIVFAIIINLAAFKIFAPTAQFLNALWPYLVFVIQAVGSGVFAFSLTQKTVVGRNLMLQAKGLQYSINTGKWREEIKEKNLFIEEVLPFAIALGVINKLARDMEGLNLKPPEYMHSFALANTNWSTVVSDFSTQAASSLSYNPSSSSYSGGSGFSGGSSGGGGGGGGGGSW